jgi:quinol monooxygenase YgiN
MPIVLPTLPESDPADTGPFCVIAKHRAKPGRADDYERRMLADLARTRSEPGALQFHIHRDRYDRSVFVIYEVWRNVEALREHFGTPYVRQFVLDSAEYIDGDMDVQWLVMASEYISGKPVFCR